MSSISVLAKLLEVSETELRKYIDQLEQVCLRPGIDIRLGTEVSGKINNKISELGLDASDTTAKEFFYGLKNRLRSDDALLQEALNLKPGSFEQNAKAIARTCQRISSQEKCLALSSAGVKRLLKAVPPRKTMRLLKIRSLDSALKRENAKVLYSLACLVEDESWRSQANAKIRRLNAKDIEWQKVECTALPKKWYDKLHRVLNNRGVYIANNEAGIVCLLPIVDVQISGSTMLAVVLVAIELQAIAAASLPYGRQALSHGASEAIMYAARGSGPVLASMHGLKPQWLVVYELFGSGKVSPDVLEVGLPMDELAWVGIESKLADLLPELGFWVGTGYLAMTESDHVRPVSLHVVDVALSVASDHEYGQHTTSNLRSSLWKELQLRYLQQDVLSRSLLSQLTEPSVV